MKMADYDLVKDFTNKADTVNNGVSTVDSGVHDINEVTNIVEYSKIYHKQPPADIRKRLCIKIFWWSIGGSNP